MNDINNMKRKAQRTRKRPERIEEWRRLLRSLIRLDFDETKCKKSSNKYLSDLKMRIFYALHFLKTNYKIKDEVLKSLDIKVDELIRKLETTRLLIQVVMKERSIRKFLGKYYKWFKKQLRIYGGAPFPALSSVESFDEKVIKNIVFLCMWCGRLNHRVERYVKALKKLIEGRGDRIILSLPLIKIISTAFYHLLYVYSRNKDILNYGKFRIDLYFRTVKHEYMFRAGAEVAFNDALSSVESFVEFYEYVLELLLRVVQQSDDEIVFLNDEISFMPYVS